MRGAGGPGLDGLLGRTEDEVRVRLGPPDAQRAAAGNRWLVYDLEEGTLRIRCRTAAAGSARVASWTVTFSEGRGSLREATEPLGLWPACAPDAEARLVEAPMLRRAVRERDAVHSLTARVRASSIDQVTLFDEAPEWKEPPRGDDDSARPASPRASGERGAGRG